jgi:hypothetical protein
MPCDHRSDRIGAANPVVQRGHCPEDRLRIEPVADRSALELMREHVEQYFGIRIGVDVPQVLLEHLLLQRIGVRQVAVMAEDNAERRVDVKRLRLGRIERGPAVG